MLPLDTPDHPLGNTKEVSALLSDSINRLRRGQLDPRVANAMGYLTSVFLRALEQGPIEERLARLEATLGLAPKPHPHAHTPRAPNRTTGAGCQSGRDIRS